MPKLLALFLVSVSTFAHAAVITPQLRADKAVGSMAAGSNVLLLKTPAQFRAGDQIIVEIGGEAGRGQRGTQGVGGVTPGDPNDGRYYQNADAPRSLTAKVVTVEGHFVTLDKSAIVATRDAVVHYDNLPAWNAATFWDEANPVTTQGDVLVTLPAGSFAFSDQVPFWWHKPGWIIAGQGDDRTELFSPKGTTSIALYVFESPKTTVRDLRLRGNVADHGYGTTFYQAALDLSLSPEARAFNVVTVDAWRGLNVSYSYNTTAENFRAYLTQPLRIYVSWQIAFANSEGGGCWNCAVLSRYVTAGLESFQSSGQTYKGNRLFGAIFSSNSSRDLQIDDLYIRLAAGSAHLRDMLYNPMVNLNLNVDTQQGSELPPGAGGTYKNVTMIQDGYIGADPTWGKWFMASGINVDPRTSDLNVVGGSFWVPDVTSDNLTKAGGVTGVNNYGGNKNVVVDGFLSCGLTDEPPMWQANIRNTDNVVRIAADA